MADHARRITETGVGGRALDQEMQHVDGSLGLDDVRHEARTAGRSQDLAVVGHDRHVRLRVAGIHGQHRRAHAHGR